MSADLFTSEIDEKEYGTISIEMRANGLLEIVIFGKDSPNEDCQKFLLPPTEEGWKEATNLIGALQEWVNHTKELEEQKIWAEGFTKGLDR